MGGLGFIRLGVWQNFVRAWKSGYQGNMNGEGFILGGVFVIGAGEQVAYYTHDLDRFFVFIYMMCMLWFAGGSPGTPRERIWKQSGDCSRSRGRQEDRATEINVWSEWRALDEQCLELSLAVNEHPSL